MTVADQGLVGADRRRRWLPVVASVVGLVGLLMAAFMYAMAHLITYGLYSWTDPELDPAVTLPVIGVGLTLPLGTLVMALGPQRRRWLWIAAAVSLAGMSWLSVLTWIPVALGMR